MAKGSYRGASTIVGWNANRLTTPSIRPTHRSANDRTAKTVEEAQRANAAARKRLRLKNDPKATTPKAARPGECATGTPDGRLRRRSRTSSPLAGLVVVVKRRRRAKPKPKPD